MAALPGKDVWKCAGTIVMEPFVMTDGMCLMQEWHADSYAFLVMVRKQGHYYVGFQATMMSKVGRGLDYSVEFLPLATQKRWPD